MSAAVYCALLHHPVRDRAGETVTTAVTNLDVHDIARSAHTYGLQGYHVVTPIDAQHALVRQILEHWRSGDGKRRVPERTQALAICEVAGDLERVRHVIQEREGSPPVVLGTAARALPGRALLGHQEARRKLERSERPWLLLFGTGHGLTDRLLHECDHVLAPIRGVAGYNHLSVRAAVAILLDRLRGVSS